MSDTITDRWVHHMQQGDFEAAWQVNDHLRRAGSITIDHGVPRHHQHVWDGTPLDGRRVLVRCYHGLGDTIQFARYLPQLAAIAAEVTLWVQPSLLGLLGTMRGVDVLLALHDGDPGVPYDVDVEIMELPYIFRSTLQTVPDTVPYLHVSRTPAAPARTFMVGVVWEAGDWDPRRNIPLTDLAHLAQIPGVALVSLQRGRARAAWPPALGADVSSDDALQTARTMQSLDLVLSVDSMPAHLAGALGLPVWTLLQRAPDWRWQQAGSSTPWYPTMRLFRQPVAGDWRAVVTAVDAALREVVLHRFSHVAPWRPVP